MDSNAIFHYISGTVFVCSILHTFLPPWDFLDEFPTAQKYYKIVIYLVGYIAINGRSSLYTSISVQNPKGPNTSPTAINTAAKP